MDELDILKTILVLLMAVAGLIGAFTVLIKILASIAKKATEGERRLQNERITDLKNDRDNLEKRVAGLEKAHQADQARIKEAEDERTSQRKQLNTLCVQIEELQKRLDAAEKRAENKQAENEQLTAHIKTIEKQNADLFDANKTLTIERNTYKSALILVGTKLAEAEHVPSETAEHESNEPEAAPEPRGEQSNG
jgi:chromosome segregation ATPase